VKLAVQLGDLSLLSHLLAGPMHGVVAKDLSLPWEEMAGDLIPFCSEECHVSGQILELAMADVRKGHPELGFEKFCTGNSHKRPFWFTTGCNRLDKSIDTTRGAWKYGDSLGWDIKLEWGSGGILRPYLEVSKTLILVLSTHPEHRCSTPCKSVSVACIKPRIASNLNLVKHSHIIQCRPAKLLETNTSQSNRCNDMQNTLENGKLKLNKGPMLFPLSLTWLSHR
jgi:hypothetical protein